MNAVNRGRGVTKIVNFFFLSQLLTSFIPSRDSAKAEAKVVELFLLSILLFSEMGFDTFKIRM